MFVESSTTCGGRCWSICSVIGVVPGTAGMRSGWMSNETRTSQAPGFFGWFTKRISSTWPIVAPRSCTGAPSARPFTEVSRYVTHGTFIAYLFESARALLS